MIDKFNLHPFIEKEYKVGNYYNLPRAERCDLRKREQYEYMKLIKIYPHVALFESDKGFTYSYTFYDLYVLTHTAESMSM